MTHGQRRLYHLGTSYCISKNQSVNQSAVFYVQLNHRKKRWIYRISNYKTDTWRWIYSRRYIDMDKSKK